MNTAFQVDGKVHCEMCGQDDPKIYDGYTVCCNELPCYGGTTTGIGTHYDFNGDRITEFKHEKGCRKVTR